MPNVGVLNLNTPRPANQALGQSIGQYLDLAGDREVERRDSAALEKIYNKYRGDQDMIQKTFQAIQTNPEISNHKKVSATKDLLDLEKYNVERIKATKKDLDDSLEKKDLYQALLEDDYPEHEAKLYINSPPGVQQRLTQQHNELKSRGLRGKNKSNPTNNQVNADVNPVENSDSAQLDIDTPEEEWPEIPLPENTTFAEQEKFKAKNQTENNKALVKAREKSGAVKGIKVRLSLLNQYSEKLPKNMGRIIIDPDTGELQPLASLAGVANKETQAYVKTLNDFLSEAKNYFGGRVTNFDVQAFKSRLPGLLNTEEGRRLILKQMELINELEAAHVEGEEEALKHYGRNASYSDIVKIADKRVAKKEANIIDRINDLEAASNYMDLMAKNPTKFKDTVLMRDTETGKFKAVDKSKVAQRKEEGWQVY